uniref:Rho-GAP domain-containing protein n=1 Tax=Ditylenchus dipsaci TaxID=166011 RepID=A0A915DFP2_9BILA
MNIFGKKSKKDVKPAPKVDIIHNIRQPVFGVPLTEAISRSKCHDGVQVPLIVRKCIDYVAQHGMLLEGIYRISPPKGKLDELERAANIGEMDLRFNDAHEASGLLKRYLRQLPEHILTEKLKPNSIH